MRISSLKLCSIAVFVLALSGVLSCSAFAETPSPWWHLSSLSQPTYLQPGQARDEVQRVTVNAGTGTELVDRGVGLRKEGEGQRVTVSVGEQPELVQGALEGMYGTGNVKVTASDGPNNPNEVYEVTFVGNLSYRDVLPMAMRGSPTIPNEREKEVVQGRPDGQIVVTAVNLGDANANPEAQLVALADRLPAGLKAVAIEATLLETITNFGDGAFPLECALGSLSCTFNGKTGPPGRWEPPYPTAVPPYNEIQMRIAVNVNGAKSGEINEASVTGGGAAPATARQPLVVSGAPIPFGVSSYEMRPESVGGGADTQAGSHPFQLTTGQRFNETWENSGSRPAAMTKDLHFKLPPGLIGNPTPFAQCSLTNFLKGLTGTANGVERLCSAQTVVGVARVTIRADFNSQFEIFTFAEPVYNLEPAVGEPARFGFIVNQEVPVLLNTAVRTGDDYGVTVNVLNISQKVEFLGSEVTFWGVPGDERHNESRGAACLEAAYDTATGGFTGIKKPTCPAFAASHPPPLLSLPTGCARDAHGVPVALSTTLEADSWNEPSVERSLLNTEPMPALDGCGRLSFSPEIRVSPDGQQASKPTGLTVDVHVPQEGQLNGEGLAQSNVKQIVVTLPQGVELNPSAADGLQACSESQIGYLSGESHPPSELRFTPRVPGSATAVEAGDTEPLVAGVNFCPDASKIATVKIKTPLLPNQLEGAVYLASPQNFGVFPQENPFETHVAMYVVAEDPVSGSLVKLPGRVELGGAPGVEGLAPGQIRSTFEDSPQLAFEDAELHFFGGERAPLTSPAHCGTYTTNAVYTPWSGEEPVHSQSSFQIVSGPNGTPCPSSSLPFSPTLASGTTNNNAGSFTPLTTTLSREDGQQSISSVVLHYPPGVSGLLSGVKLCGEAEANAGTCGPESQIGETIVSVGLGGDPFTVTGGRVYITGPYQGAPFGLSIVNPAKAGPFDLQEGRPVVVRAKIEVNPITAALTVTTDPPGSPHAIPSILEGFALQIKHVNVLINRPGFTFNPTNCEHLQVSGAISSAEGASSPVMVPFQATNCATLAFKPKFVVSTSGKTSRASGASLNVKLSYPKAPFGSQANIRSVKVDLPKQLPSRLTTLQKACTAAQFEANPAGCPSASIVGHATAITPLIPVPLSGPAYFVSYGGAKFPELVIALQGYGVTVDLRGETFINKAGITSSTFKTVPDAPVGSFELTLPQGKYSALAANGNLCKSKLAMPTAFTAQNGMTIHESTPIGVTGCAKHKAAKKARKAKKAGHRHTKKGKRN